MTISKKMSAAPNAPHHWHIVRSRRGWLTK